MSGDDFSLDPRLAADSCAVAALPLCEVRLMHDARYPWLLLVPRQAGLVEIADLAAAEQTRLWQEVNQVAAALRLGLPSVSYYGARNLPFLHEPPRAPLMFHFGELDRHIPPEMVARHRELLPQMPVFTYPADHGFNRDVGAQYHKASAELAQQRTLEFFAQHLAGA